MWNAPDISEIGGGGGYGVVQWTSPNAWESGANYVQRLLREAGIDGDYKMASTQAKLIHYGMFHGQWIELLVRLMQKSLLRVQMSIN